MNASVFKRENCRLCGSENLKLVLKLASIPIGDNYVKKEHLGKVQQIYPIELFLCFDCGLVQLLEVLNPENVYLDYIYKTRDSLGLVEHFRKSVETIFKKINPHEGSLVVDIGSNDGSFLSFFKEKGMKILGVEPAKAIAEEANKKGIETLSDFFNAGLAKGIKNENGAAMIITSNNTFANIDDLKDVITGVRELLSAEGVFIFETGYVLDLLQKMIFDNIYHEHLSYFSVKPLEAFLSRNNLELIDVERISTKGGSLRCTAQLAGGPRKPSHSINELIKLETDLGIHQPEIFKDFATNLDNAKNQTINLLKNLKAKGRKIIGYGASIGVTTVLYNFAIGKDLLDFIVDDNPRRQNLYSPGLHIPVLSPQEIYKQKPDYVIILAWQYSEPIIKKHQEYLNQGGYFIVILPQLRIVGNSSKINQNF